MASGRDWGLPTCNVLVLRLFFYVNGLLLIQMHQTVMGTTWSVKTDETSQSGRMKSILEGEGNKTHTVYCNDCPLPDTVKEERMKEVPKKAGNKTRSVHCNLCTSPRKVQEEVATEKANKLIQQTSVKDEHGPRGEKGYLDGNEDSLLQSDDDDEFEQSEESDGSKYSDDCDDDESHDSSSHSESSSSDHQSNNKRKGHPRVSSEELSSGDSSESEEDLNEGSLLRSKTPPVHCKKNVQKPKIMPKRKRPRKA